MRLVFLICILSDCFLGRHHFKCFQFESSQNSQNSATLPLVTVFRTLGCPSQSPGATFLHVLNVSTPDSHIYTSSPGCHQDLQKSVNGSFICRRCVVPDKHLMPSSLSTIYMINLSNIAQCEIGRQLISSMLHCGIEYTLNHAYLCISVSIRSVIISLATLHQ